MTATIRRPPKTDSIETIEPPTSSRPFARARDVVAMLRQSPRLVEEMRGAYVVLDDYGRILEVADDVAKRLDFPPKRLVGRRLQHRVSAATRAVLAAALAKTRAGGTFAPFEIGLWTRSYEPVIATFASRASHRIGPQLVIITELRWQEDGAVVNE